MRNENGEIATGSPFELRRVSRNIFTVATPQFIVKLAEYLAQGLSFAYQQHNLGKTAVVQNIIYQPLVSILTEKLPLAIVYFFGCQIFTNRLVDNKEKDELLLTAYYQLALCLSVFLGSLNAIVVHFMANLFHIDSDYQTPLTVVVACGPFFQFFNGALQYRYLAEYRLFLMVCRGLFGVLVQLGFEYFFYSISPAPKGNYMTMWAYIISNVVLTVWQLYLAFGKTLYSFAVNNQIELRFRQIFLPTKSLLRIEGKYLVQAIAKYILDITLPLTLFVSGQLVLNSFTDEILAFNALIELYLYGIVFYIVRAVPEAFLFSHMFWTTFCVQQKCYFRRQHYVVRVLMYSLLCGAATAVFLFLIRPYYCRLLFNTKDAEIGQYFEAKSSRAQYATIVSLVMGVLDIFQLVGIFDIMANNMYFLLVLMLLIKTIVIGLTTSFVANSIGNKADYIWVLIFTESAAILLSTFYIAIGSMKYVIKHHREMQLRSRK